MSDCDNWHGETGYRATGERGEREKDGTEDSSL